MTVTDDPTPSGSFRRPPPGRAVERAGHDVVCGDWRLADGSVEQETGRRPVVPVPLMARTSGLPEEPR